MAQKAYDPTKIQVIVNGVPAFDLADIDDAVVTEYDEDRSRVVTGLTGEGAIEFMLSEAGEIRVTLKAKSPTNAQYSALYLARRQFSIKFVDISTNGESAFSKVCSVKRTPRGAYGKTKADREWIFAAANLKQVFAGQTAIV